MTDKSLELDPGFIDAEDIVAKLHFLEHMESRWPYGPAKGFPLATRVTRSLTSLPREFSEFALAVFANVVYLPGTLLRESWSFLAEKIAQRQDTSVHDLIENCHLLEVDPSGLIRDFLHENRVEGRLDTDRFSRLQSIEELARCLLLLAESDSPKGSEAREIRLAFSKRYWLVLTDNVLSGTSLESDLTRCQRLIPAYADLGTPTLIPVAQVFTSTAAEYLPEGLEVTFALYFDEQFRVAPDNEECTLFGGKETLEGIVRLSRWLASQESFAKDELLLPTLAKSGDDMALGFKAGGWTIVTPNCPTNSLPILWYARAGVYEGPFPRIMSRTSQARGVGEELTDAAVDAAPQVLARLGGAD